MNAKVLMVLSEVARTLYKMDRDHRYGIRRNWSFVVNLPCPSRYDGTYIRLVSNGPEQTIVTIIEPGDCDGATFAPDGIPGATEGALFHDPFYREMHAIWTAWHEADPHISKQYVREWGDNVFAAVMDHYLRKSKIPFARKIRRIYYRAVRAAGGVFRWAKKLFIIAACAGVMHLISGCAVPGADLVIIKDDPEFYYEKISN